MVPATSLKVHVNKVHEETLTTTKLMMFHTLHLSLNFQWFFFLMNTRYNVKIVYRLYTVLELNLNL